MDGRIMKWGLMLLLCIPFWTACNNDDVPEAAIEPQKDCEVSVSIRLNAKSLRAMGDPGEEVDEFDSQYWTYRHILGVQLGTGIAIYSRQGL